MLIARYLQRPRRDGLQALLPAAGVVLDHVQPVRLGRGKGCEPCLHDTQAGTTILGSQRELDEGGVRLGQLLAGESAIPAASQIPRWLGAVDAHGEGAVLRVPRDKGFARSRLGSAD